ncbi:hypothetical protein D030_1158B, partial [Vibrio parahaemolyticus AQ3810]
ATLWFLVEWVCYTATFWICAVVGSAFRVIIKAFD